MPGILAIETSTEACSAALAVNGQITTRYELTPQTHTQRILPMCAELCAEHHLNIAQLDAIAFGCGPGSFTGVRLAVSVAQGLALAHHLPVIAISSLQALAQTAYARYGFSPILAGIDARMYEIYWGEFQLHDNIMQLVGEEKVTKITQIPVPLQSHYVGAGSAWQNYGDQIQAHLPQKIIKYYGDIFPTAQAVAALALVKFSQGLIITAENALPSYLRNNVVHLPSSPS